MYKMFSLLFQVLNQKKKLKSCHGLFPAPRSLLVEPFAPHKAQRSEGEGQAVRFETPPKSPSTAEVYSAR